MASPKMLILNTLGACPTGPALILGRVLLASNFTASPSMNQEVDVSDKGGRSHPEVCLSGR